MGSAHTDTDASFCKALTDALINDGHRQVILAVAGVEEVDAVLQTLKSTHRFIKWDLLRTPSYSTHGIPPLHARLDTFFGDTEGRHPNLSRKVIIRITNVDIDFVTRSGGALEIIDCLKDPAVNHIVIVNATTLAPWDNPMSMVSKKSKTLLSSAVTRILCSNNNSIEQESLNLKRGKKTRKKTQGSFTKCIAIFDAFATLEQEDYRDEAACILMNDISSAIKQRITRHVR